MIVALIAVAIGLAAIVISAASAFDAVVSCHTKRGALGDGLTRRREGRGGRDTSND